MYIYTFNISGIRLINNILDKYLLYNTPIIYLFIYNINALQICFSLYNIMKIRPFLSEHATQLLVHLHLCI